MADFTPTRLFDLLPQIYRVRDSEPMSNGALEALLDIVDEQVGVVREDITRLWENLFIETCDDWVIPYIGDLVGTNLVSPIGLRARTDVAKTIHYRRRKGTVPMLEELARDVTGWSAKVIEFFQILAWTQNVNHVRLDGGGWFGLGDDAMCANVNTAFDQAAHTLDVRLPAQAEGWHNIRNIGFFLWRLQSYSLIGADPYAEPGKPHRFHFNSLGQPQALFIQPQGQEFDAEREHQVRYAVGEDDVRGPINQQRLEPVMVAIDQFDPPDVDGNVMLHVISSDVPRVHNWIADLWLELIDPTDQTKTESAVLKDVRSGGSTLVVKPDSVLSTQTHVRAFPHLKTYYGNQRGFGVYVDGELVSPVAQASCKRRVIVGDLCNWAEPAPDTLVIDVRLGRFAFAKDQTPQGRMTVDYNYGFSGDIGAGPYYRAMAAAATTIVTRSGAVSLDQALIDWQNNPTEEAIIEIQDSHTYKLALSSLKMPTRLFRLTIRALSGERPTIVLPGDLKLIDGDDSSSITLDGLLISGGKLDLKGRLGKLNIRNCTLDPGGGLSSDGVNPRPRQPSMSISVLNTKLSVVITRSIVGALRVPSTIESLAVSDSLIDGQGGAAIVGTGSMKAYAARTSILSSTVLGECRLQQLTLGSASIFRDPVTVKRKQNGCVRFSYVDPDSETPRRYHCVPPEGASKTESLRLKPAFVSIRFGDPGYAQLSHSCPHEISEGTEDGSEMGAFCMLKNPLRVQNLLMRLDEYMPFGLVPALIEVT